jgi:hypothetical protein
MLRWLATLLILAAGLLALLLALGAHLELGDARELMARGRQVEGVVTEAYAVRQGTASGYSYAYAVGGTRYSAIKRSIPRGLKEKLPPGTRIAVWYDAADPPRSTTIAEIAELEGWANRVFFPLIGLALLAWAVVRMLPRKR